MSSFLSKGGSILPEVVKILICAVVFFLFPAIMGHGFLRKFSVVDSNLITDMVFGNIVLYAFFEIICVPMILLEQTLSRLTFCILAICILICFFVYRRYGKQMFREYLQQIVLFFRQARWQTYVMLILVIGLLMAQLILQHADADDFEFVAISTAAKQTDQLLMLDTNTGEQLKHFFFMPKRILAPFPFLMAVYAVLVDVHPTIMCHTIYPVVALLLCLFTYFMIGGQFFNDREKKDKCLTFLFWVILIMVLGGYSTRTIGAMLLFRSWQGKAMLAVWILPIIFLLLLRVMENGWNIQMWVGLSIVILAGTLTSLMAEILIPILVGSYGLVFALRRRSVRLFIELISVCWPCVGILALYVGLNALL